MRRVNKVINIVNLMLGALLVGSFVSAINLDVDTYSMYIKNEQLVTYLNSNHIEKVISLKEEIDQPIIEDKSEKTKDEELKNISDNNVVINSKKQEDTNKKVENEKKETRVEEEKVDNKKNKVSKTENAIEKLTGSLAGYGPDCVGCTSFRTASGRYIGDGNIYYEDKEYGKIRIVAGDKSYPFGTIVKISNTNYGDNSPIYAVVLDRGGGVGKGKKFLFDLLFTTEKEAAKAGSRKNVIFEILRLGY